MDRGHHRLRAVVEGVDHFEEAGLLERLVEFGDVGPGDERAPGADEHDRDDRRIGARTAHGVADPQADVPAQGVDGGLVDGDDGDAVAHLDLDEFRVRGHRGEAPVKFLGAACGGAPSGGTAPASGAWYHRPGGRGRRGRRGARGRSGGGGDRPIRRSPRQSSAGLAGGGTPLGQSHSGFSMRRHGQAAVGRGRFRLRSAEIGLTSRFVRLRAASGGRSWATQTTCSVQMRLPRGRPRQVLHRGPMRV